jgi:hypothetical protein
VRNRIDAINGVEASIISPLEQSLADWKAQRKQAVANRRAGTKARKR